MKYMLLIYFDEQALNETERQACYVESTQLTHEIKASGQYLAANPLHPTAMATAVRVRDGQRFVTGGPFAETREQLGGYFLIDAKGLSINNLIKLRMSAGWCSSTPRENPPSAV